MSIKSVVKKHWKKIVGVGCGVATVLIAPAAPIVAIGLGAVCSAAFTSDYHVGYKLGRFLADVAKEVEGEKKGN
jgi:tetrahydromethanopterin S-methyltransferase subunit E